MKLTPRIGLLLTVAVIAAQLLKTNANAATMTVPVWSKVRNMTIARGLHTATRLADGRVLIVGGSWGPDFRSEIYDPQNVVNPWQIAPSMNTHRWSHQAVLLNNGKVLVVGGQDMDLTNWPWANSAETYDPGTGTWTYTAPPVPLIGFGYSAISLLNDGRVYSASGQIYDPVSNTWTQTTAPPAPTSNTAFAFDQAVLLSNGKVLFRQGGYWIYDPATDSLTSTVGNRAVIEDQLVALNDGRVMSIGGYGNGIEASADIYDPPTDTWQLIPIPFPRVHHRAVRLDDGRVLMAGGSGASTVASFTADIYDPVSNTWTPTADLHWTRAAHTATVLQDGRVLITGGQNHVGPGDMPTAEIFDEATQALLVEGGRRPSVDAFLSWSGTYLTGTHSTIYGSQVYLPNPSPENTIVLFLVTAANGETVFPNTAVIKWNSVDVTPPQVPAQGVIPLRLPVTQAKNLILSAVDGIKPGSQQRATDTDRLVLEGTIEVQPYD